MTHVFDKEQADFLDDCLINGVLPLPPDEAVLNKNKATAERLIEGHPADCICCPKTGECIVQKICTAYQIGMDNKAVSDKDKQAMAGGFVRVIPERCILCQKCKQFLEQVDLSYSVPVKGFIPSLLTGNLIDICPAGTLINKTLENNRFRFWEFNRTPSVDFMDPLAGSIYIDSVRGKIVRIMPRVTENNKMPLISDISRFAFDGLSVDRLDQPYLRKDGILKKCSWTDAFSAIAAKVKVTVSEKIAGIIGDFADCESMLALHDLLETLGGGKTDARPQAKTYFDIKSRQSWLFNTPIHRIKEADALLVIDADMAKSAPVIDWKLRQNMMPKAYMKVEELPELLERHPFIETLALSKKPMIVVGMNVLNRPDASAVLALIYKLIEKFNVISSDWNGYNLLHEKMSVIGALELGLISEEPLKPKVKAGEFDIVYLLNEENITRDDLGNSFVIYQGFFAGEAAKSADVLLPGLAPTEKQATYVNIEGRAKATSIALEPVGMAREDWKILRALSDYLGKIPLPYNILDGVRDHLAGKNIIFYKRGEISPAENIPFGVGGDILKEQTGSLPYSCFNADGISHRSKNIQLLKELWEKELLNG